MQLHVGIQPDRTTLDAVCEAQPSLLVAAPDARRKPKAGVVRLLDRVVFVAKRINGQQRTEYFLLQKFGIRILNVYKTRADERTVAEKSMANSPIYN